MQNSFQKDLQIFTRWNYFSGNHRVIPNKCTIEIRIIRRMQVFFPLSGEEKFDVIFIDADKENYIQYYKLAMQGLLTKNGFILADNSMCALLYDFDDERSRKLHEFNQFVKNDSRVEQVILTIREGITLIKPIQ